MRISLILIMTVLLMNACDFNPSHSDVAPSGISKIENYVEYFSRNHKTWMDNADETVLVNKAFADSLSDFYNIEKDAFDHLSFRLESFSDSVNGKNLAGFECWDHYTDNKLLRAHLYVPVTDSLRKKLSVGSYYFIFGKISEVSTRGNVGYNSHERSCDVGIVTVMPDSIIRTTRNTGSRSRLD